MSGYKVTAIFDEREKARDDLLVLAREYECESFYDINSFLNSDINIVIECATIAAVKKFALEIVKKKDLLLISIGALADLGFDEQLEQIAREYRKKVYLPSGAIGGIDVLKAAQLAGELDTVTLTTRKPAPSLTSEVLLKEKVLFEGLAQDAIKQFPKNANVAIVLSKAGVGVKNTKVRIIADPGISKNIHHIEATGAFGELEITVKNNPLPNNPKTSYLTGLSILAALNNLHDTVILGS